MRDPGNKVDAEPSVKSKKCLTLPFVPAAYYCLQAVITAATKQFPHGYFHIKGL